MILSPALEALLAAGIGLTAAALLFLWWNRTNTAKALAARQLIAASEGETVLLFDDDSLLDATPQGRALLAQARSGGSDWDRLVTALEPRFPDLRAQGADVATSGQKTVASEGPGKDMVEMTYLDGVVRVALLSPQNSTDPTERLIVDAMEQELTLLRSIGDNAPQLIWQRNTAGDLVWANRAYLDLVDDIHPPEAEVPRIWPPQDLFDDVAEPGGAIPVIEEKWLQSNGRLAPRCYEVSSVRRDVGTMHYAVDVTEVIEAREDQQKFVQTLAKTFAQLSVGLAIFDRDRRLTLFNPALTDMLQIPTDFLISRPHIGQFLDRLREARMIPEPKDYAAWRTEVEAVETAAENDSYCESWDLPNGQTFRVTGRPHPDGALAFLFEDISEELSMTRRFRSQIEMGQQILDSMTEAAVAFSATGEMVMSNRAYRLLWGSEGHLGLGVPTFADELAVWRANTAPNPFWHRLSTVSGLSDQVADIQMHNGHPYTLHFSTLSTGHRLVRFAERETNAGEGWSGTENLARNG